MELKVGKGNDKVSDKIDVAETKSAIRHNRNIVDILKRNYEKATTDEEKRVIGTEINSINNDIKSLRDKLREVALDSVFIVQELEAENDTARGELHRYRNIDQSKVDDVLKEFSGRYDEMYDARDEIKRKLETAVGGEERNLQGEFGVLDAATLHVGIVARNEMIEGLLPDAIGIDSAEDVAKDAKAFSDEKRKDWFDDGNIKDDSLEIIKYGRPASVRYEPIPGTDELKEIREGRIVGVLEQNIDERTDAISNVAGVWTTIGETDTKKGTPISFSTGELNKLAKIKTPGEMVERINDRCTTMQRYAFASAVGIIDKDGSVIDKDGNIVGKDGNVIGNVDEHGNISDNEGNIVGKVDVVCNVPETEIYDAFNRMKELETGVPGSGYEYMQRFLKILLRYGAFEDDVYDEMSEYDSLKKLMDRIGKEIRLCSCTITDIHEDAVSRAFDEKSTLERESKGKGTAFMNRSLRNIFNCDTFEDHVYKDISEYEDPGMLVDKINTELSNAGVYDRDVLKYAISGINRRAVLDKESAEKQLDDVFGDHFTKGEYEEAAKHITDEDTVVDDNISALSSIFKNIGGEIGGVGKEGQIRAGKILEGITNEDYNDRWDKERQKMVKHGETKNIDAIIARRQLEAAQKQFDMLLRGIPDESMSSRDEIQYVFESVGLQEHVVNKLIAGVTDIEYAVDNNIKRLSIGMKELIKKHDMYEDDIFTKSRVYDAVEKRAKMNLGDADSALAHMKDAILKSVGKLDMTEYGKSITGAMSKKIKTDYGDLDEVSLKGVPKDDITEQFSHRIQKYREDANASMRDVEEAAIRDMYAGRPQEDDVDVPNDKELDKERKERKERKKALKESIAAAEAMALGVPERLVPFIAISEIEDYTAAIPKKPKDKKQIKWWESYMAKNEPVFERMAAFNTAGLALIMRKGAGDKYAVFGEDGESVSFSNLSKLDKWFNAHYGKKQVD